MFVLASGTSVVAFPYSIAALRADNPSTSFPSSMDSASLAGWGVYEVEESTQPSYDGATESIVEVDPIYQDGKWVRQWKVVKISTEEVEARAKGQAASVRSLRNIELSNTDWTQLQDSAVDKQYWAAYRQQLRDIPQQAEFPWNVQWPDGYEA